MDDLVRDDSIIPTDGTTRRSPIRESDRPSDASRVLLTNLILSISIAAASIVGYRRRCQHHLDPCALRTYAFVRPLSVAKAGIKDSR